MNFDIYTTGGIEFISQVYKGVIMTFGDSTYETLLRLFGLFSIIFGSIALIGKQQIDYLAKRVAILFLISGFSFGLRADVTIIDTKHDQIYVVSGAPWIPAYIHSLFSGASYQLTNVAQQVFHTGTVNVYDAAATGKNAWGSVNLDYNKTGFGGFFEYLNFFKNYRFNTTGITDLDKIYRKFHIVLTECTINEIPLWPDFQKKVMLSSNLIQDLRPTVNGYVEFEGKPTDCITLYDEAINDWNTIKSKFDTAGDPTLNLLAKLGITAMDSQKVQEANAEILQQGTMQLSNMIGQAGMVWALSDAWDSFLADQSPERAMVYKYEVGRNIEESKQMGRSLGLYAKETVPLMKIVFESMTIAFIPVTFLIILVSGGNVIRNSIFSFAWVYAWDPVLATINGIVNIAAIAKVKAALNAAAVYNNALNGDWMGYSIQALNIMYSTLDYIPSVAGYLAISTPGIAYMLIKGGEMTMASIAGMMATPVMSAPTHMEAASSLETQKIATQTGKSFGQVEMQYNAAGQAKLNAMVFQSGANKHGYNTLEKSGMGSFEKGVAGGLGDKMVMDKFGINTVANAAANTEAGRVGSGSVGDMDTHFDMGAKGQKMNFARTMALDNIVQTQYGGNYEAFGRQQAANDAATASFINKAFGGDVNKYTNDFLIPQQQRAWGDLKGDMSVYNAMADKYGFKDYSDFRAFQSEIQGLQTFSNAAQRDLYMEQLAEKHGISREGAYEAVADMEAFKTFSKYERFDALTDYTKSKGVDLKDLARSWDGESGFALNKEQAKILAGKDMAGKYNFTVDDEGKAVFAEGKGGRGFEQLNVNKTTIDSSTTIDAGTHIKGAKGLTDYSPQALLHKMSMGDRDIITPVSTAVTNASKNAAINDLAAQSSGAVTPFVKTSGKNLHNAIASASLSVGAGTPALSPIQAKAGVEGKVEIGSRQETNYNLMTQGYRHVLTAAAQEADKLGLKGQDRNVFISNTYNEFNEKLFKNIDKEQGFGIHRPKELVRQSKENLLEKKPSSQTGSW